MAKDNKRKKKSKISGFTWLLYTALVSLPTVWFTFLVPYYGDIMKVTKVINEQVRFTKFGIIATAVIVILLLVIMYYNDRFKVQTEIDDLQYEVSYLRTITDNVDRICNEKSLQLQKVIKNVKTNHIAAPKIISNPNNQLKGIVLGIKSCLVDFLETSENSYAFKDFYVTLTYNFPQENDKWEWTDGTTEKYMSLGELLADGAKSTFNYLRNSRKPYYFNNRKEDAKREEHYMYNPQDEVNADNGESAGSIFCYNFKIKKENTVYVDAMLSISTQKKRFAQEDDKVQCKNAEDNLILLVKDYFGKRIEIELCLLYLEYLNRERNGLDGETEGV